MIPHWLRVLFLLAVCAGMLAVAYRGNRVGEIRAGLAMLVWGLLALLSMASDLKW